MKIFLNSNFEEYQKQKRTIEMQIKESQAEESSSNGIVSMFERGMAWMTTNKESVINERVEDIP